MLASGAALRYASDMTLNRQAKAVPAHDVAQALKLLWLKYVGTPLEQGSELPKVSPRQKTFRGAGEPAAGKAEKIGLTGAPTR